MFRLSATVADRSMGLRVDFVAVVGVATAVIMGLEQKAWCSGFMRSRQPGAIHSAKTLGQVSGGLLTTAGPASPLVAAKASDRSACQRAAGNDFRSRNGTEYPPDNCA